LVSVGPTESECGSNALPAVVSLMDATIGLMPQLSVVISRVVVFDRLPSLSTMTALIVQVPDATLAANCGTSDVLPGVSATLLSPRVTDHRYEPTGKALKHSELG